MKKLILPLLAFALVMPVAAMACSGKGMSKGGAHFDTMDSNGDGAISAEEHAAAAATHFSKMDANGDGKLTRDEMKKRWKKEHKNCPMSNEDPQDQKS